MANITPLAPKRSDLVPHIFWIGQSRAAQGYYVINGYKVHENTVPDMDLLADVGWCNVAWALKNQASQGTITMVPDDTNPLISVIYVDASGTLQKYDGTPAADSDPLGGSDWHQYVAPCVGASIPMGTILALVYVEAAATAIHNADIWMIPQMGVGKIKGDLITGTMDGSNKSFTLPHSPLNNEMILVKTGGLVMQPTVDYSVSGTALTLVDLAPNAAEGDYLSGYYEFVA